MWFSGFIFLILSLIAEVYLWWKLQASLIFLSGRTCTIGGWLNTFLPHCTWQDTFKSFFNFVLILYFFCISFINPSSRRINILTTLYNLTAVFLVYSEDPSVQQRADSVLSLLVYLVTDPVLSGVKGLISELKPEQHNLHLWRHNHSTCRD